MEDLVDFHVQREGDVVPDHFKPWVIKEVSNIVFGGGVVVIYTDHFKPVCE